MINKIFQLISVLFFVSVYAGTALAHGETPNSIGINKSGAVATDIWAITCTKGPEKNGAPIVTPTRLAFHVKDIYPLLSAVISIQAFKGTLKSPVYIDPKDNDTLYGPSGFASLYGGAGTYVLKITKSASTEKKVESYIPQFHCWSNKDKEHSKISWRLLQNQ
jgi:hypothetical protein